jgi:glycosyltransferase involved in cell wall biosynthesis
LQSLLLQDYKNAFEIVVVEDGSSLPCKEIVEKHQSKLDISYYFKSNSGPGDSRNYGMVKARGVYFIIFDSDCIIPSNY